MAREGTIVITGAGGNLGRSSVQALSEEGFHVSAIIDARHTLPASTERINYYSANLTEEEPTANLIDRIVEKEGEIIGAVMIVGGFAMGSILDTDMPAIDEMYKLNFQTAYHTARPCFRHMKASGQGGKLIFIGAKPAMNPKEGKGVLAYSLTKGMIFHLAEMLNAEGESDGIVSTVIAPSIIDTPPNRKAMPNANFDDWVSPKSISRVIAFLFSEDSKDLRSPIMKLYGNV